MAYTAPKLMPLIKYDKKAISDYPSSKEINKLYTEIIIINAKLLIKIKHRGRMLSAPSVGIYFVKRNY